MSEQTFDEFLAQQGLLERCEDHAIKELIAEQLLAAMEEQSLTKVEMAARMKTRPQRDLARDGDPPREGRVGFGRVVAAQPIVL